MDRGIFGRNVRKYRLRAGLTQEGLAYAIGKAPSQIGRIERGEVNPGLDTIIAIAKGLNIPPGKLFENLESSQ